MEGNPFILSTRHKCNTVHCNTSKRVELQLVVEPIVWNSIKWRRERRSCNRLTLCCVSVRYEQQILTALEMWQNLSLNSMALCCQILHFQTLPPSVSFTLKNSFRLSKTFCTFTVCLEYLVNISIFISAAKSYLDTNNLQPVVSLFSFYNNCMESYLTLKLIFNIFPSQIINCNHG